MTDIVDVVSLYGPQNAGVRARALDWLDRLATGARLTSYTGGSSAGLRDFARSPGLAITGEWKMRRLASERPSRLLLSREATPFGRGRLEERLLRHAAYSIYDIDDALFLDRRSAMFEALFSKRTTTSRSVRAADAVICGNDYLADWAASLAPAKAVHVVPTCVAPERYRVKQDYQLADPPSIVWLGTPSGERYLEAIGRELLRLHEEYRIRLIVIGSPRPVLGRLETIIDRQPWNLDFVHQHLSDFDVGIMPLADTPYERGKCAYKLLEYGAAGLPVVASPVGVNADVLASASIDGPVANSDWFGALRAVIEAPVADREQQARRLNEVVGAEYSFDRHLARWREVVLG